MVEAMQKTEELVNSALLVAEAGVRYNAARRAIINLRHTAKIREEEDGTPVIAQAGANAARDELKAATLELDATVERYERAKAEMAG